MSYEYTSITSIYMRSVRKKVASIETRIREIFAYDVASMDDDTRESIVDECVNILEKLNEMSWVVPHNVEMDTAHIFRCEIDEVKLSVVEEMKKMRNIRTWKQKSGIEIDEVEFDGERRAFEVSVNGNHVVTIYADTPGQSMDMITGLDAGDDVRDWEDGNGNCVSTLIAERTGAGLRETLRRLEEEGMCYNDWLGIGGDGTVWVDEVNGVNDIYYEYETDDLDLRVDDLTDEELRNVVIRGL